MRKARFRDGLVERRTIHLSAAYYTPNIDARLSGMIAQHVVGALWRWKDTKQFFGSTFDFSCGIMQKVLGGKYQCCTLRSAMTIRQTY